jgi:hypothetical protein
LSGLSLLGRRPVTNPDAERFAGVVYGVAFGFALPLGLRSEQVFDAYRQVAHPDAGGMVDGCCDRGCDSGEADLSNAAGSVLSQHGIGNIKKMNID